MILKITKDVYTYRNKTELQNNVYDIPQDSSLTIIPKDKEKFVNYILEVIGRFPIILFVEIRKTKIVPSYQSL